MDEKLSNFLQNVPNSDSKQFCVQVCTMANLTDAIMVMRSSLIDLAGHLATLQLSLLVLTAIIGVSMMCFVFLALYVICCTSILIKKPMVTSENCNYRNVDYSE